MPGVFVLEPIGLFFRMIIWPKRFVQGDIDVLFSRVRNYKQVPANEQDIEITVATEMCMSINS